MVTLGEGGEGTSVSVNSTYIFTWACICATFISATFVASLILEFFSVAALCSAFASSS